MPRRIEEIKFYCLESLFVAKDAKKFNLVPNLL
jgi:hypothetical protein